MKVRRPVTFVLLLGLSGCSTVPEEIGREPALSPVGSGLMIDRVGAIEETVAPPIRGTRNSTWRDPMADLFKDPRAAKIGDILTVRISMKDKATLDNTSNRSRDAKRGLGGTLNYALDLLGISGEGDGDVKLDVEGSTSTQGKGAITRSESIDLTVAAVVTEVLPNGNLVISGSQETRVNYEVRVLNVAGVVRPRDIGPENTIPYDKIAEARISYGGRGRIMEVQQPGWGHQILDAASPF